MFQLFKNLISQKYFHYFDDNLLLLLTKYILNFSFLITNSVSSSKDSLNSTNQQTTNDGYILKPFSKQQQTEIKSCIDLIDKLVGQLTSLDCINHVVLCLCELLDITYQNQLHRNEYAVNRADTKMASANDSIIIHIFEVTL